VEEACSKNMCRYKKIETRSDLKKRSTFKERRPEGKKKKENEKKKLNKDCHLINQNTKFYFRMKNISK